MVMRILILEEDQSVQQLFQKRLEKEGHEIEIIGNDHQGFQLATSAYYDVIISDIRVPYWDGFKFIDAVQVICPHIPFIIITSDHQNEETIKRLEACSNVSSVFSKPVDYEKLFERFASITALGHTSLNKKARIVCTIGPSCDSPNMLGKMMIAGMDVARLNFSHGNYEQHERNLCAIREAERRWDKPVAVLQDLCGPKIRTGPMINGGIVIVPGDTIRIQAEPIEGTTERISTIMPAILPDLCTGESIFLDDGLLELRVVEPGELEVVCEVVVGGTLKSSKGINLPSSNLSLPSVTKKDWQDLDWALEHSVDYVALSFVRTAEEIQAVKDYIEQSGKRIIKVVAKVERPEAVQNIKDIIDAADAIMIARGDMGVELPVAIVPRIQKKIIHLCWEKNKPVITATQMLDSMTTNSRPTRAEVTDVSTAVAEGTDAVMLSQETATGNDPINVVRTMASIIREEERYKVSTTEFLQKLTEEVTVISALSGMPDLVAVLLLDADGQTYPSVSKWNRRVPILLVTKSVHIARQASLYNNIFPLIIREEFGRDEMVKKSISLAKEWGYIWTGNLIGVVEGACTTASGFQQVGAVQVMNVF
jgi:pyruvate kinase